MHEIGYWEGAIDERTPCAPTSKYGISKNALRQLVMEKCRQENVVVQWLRGFYIVGDDERNHSIFAKLLQAESEGRKTFPFTSGKNKYDFLSIYEMAVQIVAASLQKDVQGIINCCSGKAVSLGEMIESYLYEHGMKIKLAYGTYPDRPYDSPIVYGDNSKIKSILNERNEDEKTGNISLF